jgi:lysine/ornithine N-monooxygenase
MLSLSLNFFQELKALVEIIDGIFNAVFMHRSRDTDSDVRTHCLSHITEFISFHPEELIRQEYLKYLGWACNDTSSQVRIASIQQIRKLVEVRIHIYYRFKSFSDCDVTAFLYDRMINTYIIWKPSYHIS